MRERDEEIRLEVMDGQKNPFRTPERYFETLTDRIVSNLPYQRKKRNNMWRWAVAAIMTGVVAAGSITLMQTSTFNPNVAESAEGQMEDALEYSMIGNNEIATFLTEAE